MTSIVVWECSLMCMCMVTLLSMRFCVFICVYSCMYLLNCILIDCLYYWSLVDYVSVVIVSREFALQILEWNNLNLQA